VVEETEVARLYGVLEPEILKAVGQGEFLAPTNGMVALDGLMQIARCQPEGRDDVAILAALCETAIILAQQGFASDAFLHIARRLAKSVYDATSSW